MQTSSAKVLILKAKTGFNWDSSFFMTTDKVIIDGPSQYLSAKLRNKGYLTPTTIEADCCFLSNHTGFYL